MKLIVILSAMLHIYHAVVAGTCASIGYTTGCCPPDVDCKATDGYMDCYCNFDCHQWGDCCSDIVDVCPRREWSHNAARMNA